MFLLSSNEPFKKLVYYPATKIVVKSRRLKSHKVHLPRHWFLIKCKDVAFIIPTLRNEIKKGSLQSTSTREESFVMLFHLSEAFIECIFILNMHKGKCTKCALVITSIFCLNLGIDCLDLSNTILLFEKGTKPWDAQRRWREREERLEMFLQFKAFSISKEHF